LTVAELFTRSMYLKPMRDALKNAWNADLDLSDLFMRDWLKQKESQSS
jgi:hypothetical protein